MMDLHLNNSLSDVTTGSSLLRCNVQLDLFNQGPITVRALIDSGSSHSFISPKVMSGTQLSIAKTQCKRQNFSIYGATGSVKCQCCITKASVTLASWSGQHEFIIANPVRKLT